MFGISFGEIALIFLVALIVFGPEKLPEISRSLGRIAGEFRRNADRFRRDFYNSVYIPASDFNKSVSGSARNLVVSGGGKPPAPDTSADQAPAKQDSSS